MMESFSQSPTREVKSDRPIRRQVPTPEELEVLRQRSIVAGDGYDEYIDRMISLGKPVELSENGKIIDLNSGYIGHRVEDRLGLPRDTVRVSSDENGQTYAYYCEDGKAPHEVGILSEDEHPY